MTVQEETVSSPVLCVNCGRHITPSGSRVNPWRHEDGFLQCSHGNDSVWATAPEEVRHVEN